MPESSKGIKAKGPWGIQNSENCLAIDNFV